MGQSISLVGTWMQQIAMSWLVYRLTNSVFILGVVAFSSQIPSFLLSPFAGVLTDRWNRRRMLIITQTLAMLQAFILAFLTFKGVIAVWHIIALGIMLGCINSFDVPARQSFIIEMIETKEALGNAIALNSFMFNGARLVGPSIAGVLIALVGEGHCFLINGVSFLAVIWSLAAMKLDARDVAPQNSRILADLKEGIVYAFGAMPIRHILSLIGITSLMGMSYVVLMPVVVKDIFRSGPYTLGFLMAAVGVGAIIGTIYLASRKSVLKFADTISVSSAIFGFGLITFSLSGILWLSIILLLVVGFGFMVQMAASNTILQTIVHDDKRGRVMSFYTMAFMGMAPLGSLLAGTLASQIGVRGTVIISGVSCVIASLVFSRKRGVIYEKIRESLETK